jgi:hypothetical protein
VKPAPGLDISTKSVAVLDGDDVQPLSKLAAHNENERAERFAFTDKDEELLQEVLAADDEQHAGD